MKPVTPIKKRHISRKSRLSCCILAALLWLGLWEAAAGLIGNELFLPAPAAVFSRLITLAGTGDFWSCVGFSLGNILIGFSLGTLAGVFLAWISYLSFAVETLLSLPLKIIRTVPVASFIILALLWISSRRLSVLISFLMVLPILYADALAGLKSADSKLLEMAETFCMPVYKRLRRIYLPALLPHMSAAISTAAGLAWKSGVAAEVIGITKQSIGNRLYQSKIYLETTELFAWTITVIIISILFEKLLTLFIRKALPAQKTLRHGGSK